MLLRTLALPLVCLRAVLTGGFHTMSTAPVSPARLRTLPGTRTAPTLLCVHGAYHDSWAFESFAQRLTQAGYPAALLDLPGRDRAAPMRVSSDIGYADFVKEVARALDVIPGEKVIIGHSLGGLLALSVAHREDVVGIVAIATPLPHAVRSKRWSLLREFPLQTLCFAATGDASHLYHHTPFTDRYFFSSKTDSAVRATATARVQAQHESRRLFRDIMRHSVDPFTRPVPTLVLWAEHDPTVTADVAQQLAQLTGGKCVRVARSGHDIMLEPGAVDATAAITEWFENMSTSTRCDD
jgi:pimeloyl-ACP methyl ester carboxylesterase